MTVAERLIELRGNQSREQVAAAINVSVSAISMYEMGRESRVTRLRCGWPIIMGQRYRIFFLTRKVTDSDK